MPNKTIQKAPIRSNSLKAKKIIRGEIRGYFDPTECPGARSALDVMKIEAEAASLGIRENNSNFKKGAHLVQVGGLAVYYDDQKKMLKKIYGNKVESWNGNKIHNTYKNLIGREYAAMLKEKAKAKAKPAVKCTKKTKATTVAPSKKPKVKPAAKCTKKTKVTPAAKSKKRGKK